MAPELFSVPEASKFLHCSPSTIRRLFYDGKLKGLRIGRKLLRFKIAELEAVLTAGDEASK